MSSFINRKISFLSLSNILFCLTLIFPSDVSNNSATCLALMPSSNLKKISSFSSNVKIFFALPRQASSSLRQSFSDSKYTGGAPVSYTHLPAESMVIATPFAEKETAFYYNQKINCMPATGKVEFDGKTFEFKEGESFGVLDWGRGVWTYKNTWYWGSASGPVSYTHLSR